MTETHRSFVNRWECDENNHMNVQFYVKRLDEAERIFRMLDADAAGTTVKIRHIRYHRELHEADGSVINSYLVKNEAGSTDCVHLMRNAVTGEICTTAVDTLAGDPAEPGSIQPDPADLKLSMPRGLDAGSIADLDTRALLAEGRAMISNYSIVEAGELDENGRLHFHRIVSRFTDGAPHIWEHSGITTDWLRANNFGRVAVELKIEQIAPCEAGTALRLVSHISGTAGRILRIHHDLAELNSARTIARGEVCALVMDLATRRATSLPEAFTGVGRLAGPVS